MRTKKQIEANYTELVHAGEGIEIEKGKISASGGSGGGSGGGGVFIINLQNVAVAGDDLPNLDVTPQDVLNAVEQGQMIGLLWRTFNADDTVNAVTSIFLSLTAETGENEVVYSLFDPSDSDYTHWDSYSLTDPFTAVS